MEWYEAFFELSDGTKFSVVHNMKGRGNINTIDAAFDNWIVRTKKFTQKSFIDYINSKGVYAAMTKEEYLKTIKFK